MLHDIRTFVCLIVAILVTGCVGIDDDSRLGETEVVLQVGQPAPDFTLLDEYERPFTLSSLRGKRVVVEFWASWCPDCTKDMPQMVDYYERHSNGYTWVAVNCSDKMENWHKAIAKEGMKGINVHDGDDRKVLNLYGIKAVPTKWIVSPEGILLYQAVEDDASFYTFMDTYLSEPLQQ